MKWINRLRSGLNQSGTRLGGAISSLFSHRRLDDSALEDLESLLITADLGVATAGMLVQEVAKQRFDETVTDKDIKNALVQAIIPILEPVAKPLTIDQHSTHVILMVGVNGVGKTTTLAKLGQQFQAEGKRIMFAAGDTFRAAAIEQLTVWSQRLNVPIIAKEQGSDAAGLAYEALQRAKDDSLDVLLIDTAGRLHN